MERVYLLERGRSLNRRLEDRRGTGLFETSVEKRKPRHTMPVTALGDVHVAKAALAAKLAEVHGPWTVHITAREALVVTCVSGCEG